MNFSALGPHQIALALAALSLDIQAQRTPLGLYRVSLPFYIALAWLGFWPLALALGLLGSLLVPALRQEVRSVGLGMLYLALATAASLWLPHQGVTLAVIALVGSLAGILALNQLPRDLQGRRLYRSLLSFQAVWPWSLVLAVNGPFESLVAAALMAVLSQGMVNVIHRVYALQATEAITQSERTQVALQQARQELSEQKVTLAVEARQRRMVERLAEQLAEGPDYAETQRALLDTVSRLLVARSVVLFLWQPSGSRLEPSCWNSPETEKLYQLSLTGYSEPLVELCWTRGRLVHRQGDELVASEVFRSEDHAMAVPLPEVGVVYVGRELHPYSRADAQLLEWVAEKAMLGLRAAWRHHHQLEQQRQQSSLNIQLREHVQLLERLVKGTGWLSSQLSVEGVLLALERELPQLLSHDFAAVFLGPADNLQQVHCWVTSDAYSNLDTTPFQQIARVALERKTSLIYANRDDSVLLSSVCVPFEDDPDGVILVAAAAPDCFQREQLHLLTLLTRQFSVTLRNANLYQEVQQAKLRLEQSQAQLIQSSKLTAIGQLAAGVAHELNTPLGAVSLSLDLLQLQFPDGNRHINNAQGAVERARNIVDKLLVYSRRTHLAEPEPVSLAQVIEGACELVQSKLRQQRVSLTCETAETPPVQAKLVELQQVVVNLMLNAIDAYPDSASEKPLLVSCGHDEKRSWIRVEDRAGGIPQEVQSQIFDPFFTTKPIGKGTGLGLSISKEICAQYGCDLSFESRAAQGTTFTMSFPLASTR